MTKVATPADLKSALRARDREAIGQAAQRLLEQGTRLDWQWFSVAHVLVRIGDLELAISAARRGVEESGESPQSRFQMAHILAIVGRQAEAINVVTDIPPGRISPIELDHFLGTCAMEIGDFDLAREAFERAVALEPRSGATWLSLAALPAMDDDHLLSELEAAHSPISATPPDSRARWHYARGAVLDRMTRAGEAFEAFAEGARLVKSTRPYDPDLDRQEADRLTVDFNRNLVNSIAGQVRIDTSRPILVTGLPRSGTTLVERMLTSHSDVGGGGELPFGSMLAREVGGKTKASLQSFLTRSSINELTRLYLNLGNQRFGQGLHFVDKGLGASRELGVLACALPQTRIIWMRRDPLDCAWSCFKTFFSHGVEWSWSLEDIARHFQAEDKLHAHWSQILGDRLLTVSYEELVADSDYQGRIFEHLGLIPERPKGTAHLTGSAVTTASLAQVRQPIYQSSVGGAERYRAYLQPFIDVYSAKPRSQPVTEKRGRGA